ncbi:MAG: hypothetical protein EOO01_15995 [Chitinophagaceae bacterium]|nr:MAG: hypothetical protein EOO01_15995 [Chitinophagaceae bacterium]
MTWLHFLTLIFALYGIYYGLLLFTDSLGSTRAERSGAPEQLQFAENPAPEKVRLEDVQVIAPVSAGATPAAVGLGGVSLKDIFELSKAKALQYTRPVSF